MTEFSKTSEEAEYFVIANNKDEFLLDKNNKEFPSIVFVRQLRRAHRYTKLEVAEADAIHFKKALNLADIYVVEVKETIDYAMRSCL